MQNDNDGIKIQVILHCAIYCKSVQYLVGLGINTGFLPLPKFFSNFIETEMKHYTDVPLCSS